MTWETFQKGGGEHCLIVFGGDDVAFAVAVPVGAAVPVGFAAGGILGFTGFGATIRTPWLINCSPECGISKEVLF